MISIRTFKSSDVPEIAQLFHDTIRHVNIKDYSEEQVIAWAPDDLYFRDWETKCSGMYTIVAEENGFITGFAELAATGYIDCFYCHKDYQGQGIGSSLFVTLQKKATDLGLHKVYAEVSITAKPFFEKMGFSVIEMESEMVRGQLLAYYRMQKIL